jgi:hypothetical protein
MNNNGITPLCFAVIVALSGCVSQDYLDTKEDATAIQQKMNELTPSATMNNVEIITRPPINTTPLVRENKIGWLNQDVQLQVNRLPLSLVLNEVLRGVPVNIWFDSDVNATKSVTLTANASRQNIFNLLSSQTG